MSSRAASWSLQWNPALVETVEVGQRWVVASMQAHGPALVTMLWRILGNDADVCDAYQDTFLQLAHYRAGRKPDNVKAFVFRTASNVAISLLRRRKLHHKACRVIADRGRNESQAVPDHDASHMRRVLRMEIERLPERLRGVLVLKDLAELPYAEVAKILGISSSTARVYRCRAMRLLGARMARQDGD